MGINPILPRNPIGPVARSKSTKGVFQGEKTAEKVSRIPFPTIEMKKGLSNRQFSVLEDAKNLSKSIHKNWNALAPEELAEKIIELENKVALFTEKTPEIEKIKKQTEHLHFKFVFPVATEIELSKDSSMPDSFARTIFKAADQIFKTGSLQAFQDLSDTQKYEVLRIAKGGKE